MDSGRVAGLLLAAGAGRRMGVPKALVRDQHGVSWAVRAVRTLAAGGCDPIIVVVGAHAAEVTATLQDEPVQVVEATDWTEGMGASLRAGLAAVAGRPVDAVLVAVVDMPGLDAAVVRRMVGYAHRGALVRATYDGFPGHPVVLGLEHIAAAAKSADGDMGARDFLREHRAAHVDCSDLNDGRDVDEPSQLPPGHRLG